MLVISGKILFEVSLVKKKDKKNPHSIIRNRFDLRLPLITY